jgi:hypothetical protein
MLTFSGNISGGYYENQKGKSNSDQSKSFNSNLKLDYSLFKNTRKAQKQTNINFSISPYDRSSSTEIQNLLTNHTNYDLEDNRSNAGINYNSANRFYFGRNLFFEINPIVEFNARYEKYESKNTTNNIITNSSESKRIFNTNFTLPLRFGVGRIENVEDARMSVFILEDLQKNNQLTKSVSDEDILAFAVKITQLRNKRHFDSRKRRIYEIQAVDSFIRDNGFSESQNAVYFSGLIDNWEYASNPWRASGNRFSIGMGPNVGYSIQNHLSVEKTISFNKGLGISLLADLEKPINLKWQRSIRLEAGYRIDDQNKTIEDNNPFKTKENYDIDEVFLNATWGYGFYPDSRSYHEILLNPTAQKVWIDRGNDIETSDFAGNISLWLDGYVYLSERFNINYSLGLRYGESTFELVTETIKKNNFATSFNLRCSYSIF